jgi:hypothetical protein
MPLDRLSLVVSSQVNIIVQPRGEDPATKDALLQCSQEAQAFAQEKRKLVVLLLHNGFRKEFRPQPKRRR